ncbi:MAG: NADH-quinone oxidoreductase subunit NuoE [Candidatus Caldatribacteriota bacterium]|nr:NADH-quinone oxidoreductase subunit NuoE [Candidatus Caldatribacteriota bacterium]
MIVKEIVKKYGNNRENLLQILHEIQDRSFRNYISLESIEQLSKEMQISTSEIKGTASFYTMFSFTPRGKYVIRVCESPPCYLLGAGTIFEAIEKKLGIKVGETTKDGLFTLEGASCLGICGVAPAMMINDEAYGNLNERKIDKILDEIKEKEGIKNVK